MLCYCDCRRRLRGRIASHGWIGVQQLAAALIGNIGNRNDQLRSIYCRLFWFTCRSFVGNASIAGHARRYGAMATRRPLTADTAVEAWGLRRSGTENRVKHFHESVSAGSRRGRNSPLATVSGTENEYRPSMLMCSCDSGDSLTTSASFTA
jgi:hypothetical protein